MIINQTTKYGLIFVGGVVLGALGAVAVAKGKKFEGVKPLASSLLSAGLDVKEKVLAGVEGVKEDLADVVAEAEAKSQARREELERKEAVAVLTEKPKAAKKTTRRSRKAKAVVA